MTGEISHYRILSRLGAGGMGEVYLAQDTKLDLKVALKILPAEVASHRDRIERSIVSMATCCLTPADTTRRSNNTARRSKWVRIFPPHMLIRISSRSGETLT